MGWESSDRRSRLPKNWKTLVARVKRRDGFRCVAVDDSGHRCSNEGREVDHIEPGDNHSLTNLQLLCREHHKAKTQTEAAQGRRRHAARSRYPAERHPGIL